MAKRKFYVVWVGKKPGVFIEWNDCRKQVEGYTGAKFKSFVTLAEAQTAFESGPYYSSTTDTQKTFVNLPENQRPDTNSIAVDAACSGNPGKMEYKGVFTDTGTELFKSKVYELGTNNIGEFLAIVHALAWQQKNKLRLPIYSDSANAISWIKAGKARSKLAPSAKNAELFEVIKRAEVWLNKNTIEVPIRKWDTKNWGEIPADFGRK